MSDQKVKRYGPQSHPMELFYEDAQGAFVLASDYEVLEARVSALEADNASLRASLAEFKGDYGTLVDLEGQAQARVAALGVERDRLREALMELRSCSRAKIGMEDDFACADAQMHAALTPDTKESPHA